MRLRAVFRRLFSEKLFGYNFAPSAKMIDRTLTHLVVTSICVQSLYGVTVDRPTREIGNGRQCAELDSPGWTIGNLRNITLDSWPWTCLRSRYTNDFLNALVSKSISDIYAAARNGDIGFVQYYAKQNGFPANVDVKKILQETAEGGDLRVLKYLVEDRALPVDVRDTTLLLSSATGGNVDLIKYLIYEKNLTRTGTDKSYRNTALHNAARAGKLDAVRFFVQSLNYNVDARNVYDETPALLAAEGGSLAVLKYLIEERGADLYAKSDFGTSLLHAAVSGGNLKVINYLITQKRLDVELKDNYERTPLQEAVLDGELDVIKYLVVERKANINTKDAFDRNLLHQAVTGKNLDVMKYLIDDLKMLPHMEDMDLAKSTVAMYAAQEGALPILKFLLDEKKANISTVDLLEHDLLQAAARENQLDVVKYLVEEKKFNVYKRASSDGRTASDIANFYNAPKSDVLQLQEYLQKKMNETDRMPASRISNVIFRESLS